MRQQQLIESLVVILTLSCSGKVLTVGDDPTGSGGESSDGGSENTGGAESTGGSESTGGNTADGGSDPAGGTDSGGSGDGGSGGSASGGAGTGGSIGALVNLPCDLFELHGHPCVAAHSTVRRLTQAYDGPLYEVCRGGAADAGPESCAGEAMDIGSTGTGAANAAAQDAFCGTLDCSITIIYDQSGRGNHLEPAPPGSAKSTPGQPTSATRLPTTVNGNAAYGLEFRPGQGYRSGCDHCTKKENSGIPINDEPETIYMVTSRDGLINGCCFDYGNGSATNNNDGNGTTEAVYFGQGVIWGTGVGDGPWVMADLENGLFPGWENGGDRNISTNTSLDHEFVTAILVGDTQDRNGGKGRFALYGGKATAEGTLKEMYDGIRPDRPGYVPMQKRGSIILGIASDNSDADGGRFYEGAIVTGAASKETLDTIHAAIVSAKYGE